MEEEKKSNLFAAAAHLRKDVVPDEILNVTDMMRPGRNETIGLSMV